VAASDYCEGVAVAADLSEAAVFVVEENRSSSADVQLLAAIVFGLRVYYLRPGRLRHNAAPNLSPFSCVVFLENKILTSVYSAIHANASITLFYIRLFGFISTNF
jgi:hypothetical protein